MNNVLTAKNSFQDGLLMDFAPENTGAGNLTNALNATLVTFNGNEMVLLNDMGNGRVETARLPEGFIPVGTCEFGDIIYIVSYNPITDKSQIGCFPSPERNISSDEISNSELSISINDFLELDADGNLTGKLKKTSVKKVIVETKKLNPGDKYILYTENKNAITANKEVLSGYGIGSIELSPKNLKLHVVSIEDSGKITYLDTTTKWYNIDNNDDNYSDYLINYSQSSDGVHDLDSYRDLLESNWSIFSSKVSGKLAILAELETIDTFSCSYDVELINTYSDDYDITYNDYKLYLYPEYTSKHEDIKPAYIVATRSAFAGEKVEDITTKNGESITIKGLISEGNVSFKSSTNQGWELTSDGKIDTGVTFKIPYTKLVKSDIPNKTETVRIKSDALIYTMLVTPTMNYGMLDHLAQDIIIDFNKIGTGEINLTTWKYHNSETTSILTFGLESYPKPNHEIKAVIIDFYDAQGLCTEYVLLDKKSYNGVFTEYILLGQPTGNFRFKNTKIKLDKLNELFDPASFSNTDIINHYTNAIYKDNEKGFKWELPEGEEGISDVNTIYPNNLYKVVIKVCSARKDNKSTLEIKSFERWYWTTSMFNDYYYNCNDFLVLQFQLGLDANVLYFSKPNFVWKEKEINNLKTGSFSESTAFDPETNSKDTFSANVAYIGGNEANLGMSIQAGLANDYGCFNLNKSDLENIEVNVYLGGGSISYDDTEYSWSGELQEINLQSFIEKKNLEIDAGDNSEDINSNSIIKQTSLNDLYNLKFADKYKSTDKYKFTDNTNSNDSEEYKHYLLQTTLDNCYYASNSDLATIDLIFKAELYNKSYVADLLSSRVNVPVYKPIISNIQDLNNLGIENIDYTMDKNFGNIKEGDKVTRLYFESGILLGSLWSTKGADDTLISTAGITFRAPDNDSPYSDTFNSDADDDYNYKFVNYDVNSSQIADLLKNTLKKRKTFFLLYPGSGTRDTAHTGSGYKIPSMYTTKWRNLYWKKPKVSDFKEHQSYITKTNVDPAGTAFIVLDYGLTPFLAVKVDEETCYMLNSAYASSVKGNAIRQASVYAHEDSSGKAEEWNTPFYDNFAQLLYLLLTHTYHANCTKTSSESILTSNIISNNPFEATLTRDIVVSLSGNPEDHDIVFRNNSFNHYVRVLQGNINPTKDSLGYINMDSELDSEIDKNVILKYIEKGVLSLLTVTKKVKPLTNSASISAYYYYGGKLNALPEELQSDTFFVLQNGELSMYKDDRELIFDADSYKLLFDHPMTAIPYKLKFSTSEGFNNYINLVFARLDNIILNSNKQNSTISISIDKKDGNLNTDINNELKKQSAKNSTIYNILAGAAWIDDTDPIYQKLFRGKTTKCTNRPSTFNIMGEEFIPEFDHYMVTKLHHMLNFEFQPYPLAFPRLKAVLKSDETPNKLIITEFMGCQLTTPIEIPISEYVSTRVPSDFEPIPIKKEVEDIYGRILTITFGHSEFMKTEDDDLCLPTLTFSIDGKNYVIKEVVFKKPTTTTPEEGKEEEEKELGLYVIEGTVENTLENTWGNLIITKSVVLPEYKVAYYDALGFKCGLGLNRAFTYNNKLEPITNMGGSFGFYCNNDKDRTNTINIGSTNLYIDSHFKLDHPELPDWSGVRNITNIKYNENEDNL